MKQIVSIKREENLLKLIIAESRFNSLSIKHLELIDLSQNFKSQRSAGLVIIEKILNQNAVWLLNLSGNDYLEKNLTFPPISIGKIKKLIPFQIESLFPYDLSKFHFKQKIAKKGQEKEVTFIVTDKKTLDTKIRGLLELEIEPDFVFFDHLGIRQILKDKVFKGAGVYIHLNLDDAIVVSYEGNAIRQLSHLEIGYSSIKDSALGFRNSHFYHEIKRILVLSKKKESDVTILSGYFSWVHEIMILFPHAQFLYQDQEKNVFALEIGNIQAFLNEKKSAIDLSFMHLPRKTVWVKKHAQRLKKAVIVSLAILCSTFFCLQKSSELKIPKILGLEGLFLHQSLGNIYRIVTQLTHQAKDVPQILDLNYHPLSVFELLDKFNQPLSQHNCQLRQFDYQVVKFPTFKDPHLPFALKINLGIEGSEKNVDALCKDLKKIKNIDSKKGIKIEKGKNGYQLEFFIR